MGVRAAHPGTRNVPIHQPGEAKPRRGRRTTTNKGTSGDGAYRGRGRIPRTGRGERSAGATGGRAAREARQRRLHPRTPAVGGGEQQRGPRHAGRPVRGPGGSETPAGRGRLLPPTGGGGRPGAPPRA